MPLTIHNSLANLFMLFGLSKTPKDSLYYHIRQRKSANLTCNKECLFILLIDQSISLNYFFYFFCWHPADMKHTLTFS